MKFNKYRVTFCIDGGPRDQHIETVEIEATTEEAAHSGAFKTKILPKYSGRGYRYYVVETELVDA